MQTTVQTIPAGTPVRTSRGRRAVTLDDTLTVTNSETGHATMTNRIKFTDDDQVCPGSEWTWNTRELTRAQDVRALRLVDGFGYSVIVRHVHEDGVQAATEQLLMTDAVEHAAQWADFGYHVGDYRVV